MKVWKISNTNTMEKMDVDADKGENVKVRVARAMLTESDFDTYLGKADGFQPIIPSKSALGLISDDVNPLGLRVGEKVLLSAYQPVDSNCTDENAVTNVAIRGVDTDGFLSNFAHVNPQCVYPIPEGVLDTDCLFYDYIAVAITTMQKLAIDKGEYVAVLGSDIQSIIFAEVVSYYQAIPILISANTKLDKIASAHGVDYFINPKKQDAIAKVFDITGGKMAEHAVYSVYSKDPIDMLFSLACFSGNVGIIGYNKQQKNVKLDLNLMLSRQLNLSCIKEGHKEIASAINMLAMRAINISDFEVGSTNFSSVDNLFASYKPGKSPSTVIVDCNDA